MPLTEDKPLTSSERSKLPKSAFAWVDPNGVGHLPYKTPEGEISLSHVRNALARLNQVKGMSEAEQAKVKAKLQRILAEHRGDDGADRGVERWDRGRFFDVGKDEYGILRARAVPARVGVYPYLSADGDVHFEFTPPETLSDDAWLRSMAMVPVTMPHPPEMIDADNARRYQVGSTGEMFVYADEANNCAMSVTDRTVIESIEAGVQELSCGYTCDLDWTSGEWRGQRYDAIQRNRRGNHLAIVEKGRHGPHARIAFDAMPVGFAVQVEDVMTTKKIQVGDAEFEVPEEVAARLDALASERDTAKSDAAAATEAKSAADAALAEAKTKLADAKAEVERLRGAVVDARRAGAADARSRLTLETDARAVMGADWSPEGKTDTQIRTAVIAKYRPATSLDGRNDAAIEALYEVALSDAKDQIEAARRRGDEGGGNDHRRDCDDPVRNYLARAGQI